MATMLIKATDNSYHRPEAIVSMQPHVSISRSSGDLTVVLEATLTTGKMVVLINDSIPVNMHSTDDIAAEAKSSMANAMEKLISGAGSGLWQIAARDTGMVYLTPVKMI